MRDAVYVHSALSSEEPISLPGQIAKCRNGRKAKQTHPSCSIQPRHKDKDNPAHPSPLPMHGRCAASRGDAPFHPPTRYYTNCYPSPNKPTHNEPPARAGTCDNPPPPTRSFRPYQATPDRYRSASVLPTSKRRNRVSRPKATPTARSPHRPVQSVPIKYRPIGSNSPPGGCRPPGKNVSNPLRD